MGVDGEVDVVDVDEDVDVSSQELKAASVMAIPRPILNALYIPYALGVSSVSNFLLEDLLENLFRQESSSSSLIIQSDSKNYIALSEL